MESLFAALRKDPRFESTNNSNLEAEASGPPRQHFFPQQPSNKNQTYGAAYPAARPGPDRQEPRPVLGGAGQSGALELIAQHAMQHQQQQRQREQGRERDRLEKSYEPQHQPHHRPGPPYEQHQPPAEPFRRQPQQQQPMAQGSGFPGPPLRAFSYDPAPPKAARRPAQAWKARSANILKYVCAKLQAGEDPPLETELRNTFGRTPATSKTLAIMCERGLLVKHGLGGRRDPYHYTPGRESMSQLTQLMGSGQNESLASAARHAGPGGEGGSGAFPRGVGSGEARGNGGWQGSGSSGGGAAAGAGVRLAGSNRAKKMFMLGHGSMAEVPGGSADGAFLARTSSSTRSGSSGDFGHGSRGPGRPPKGGAAGPGPRNRMGGPEGGGQQRQQLAVKPREAPERMPTELFMTPAVQERAQQILGWVQFQHDLGASPPLSASIRARWGDDATSSAAIGWLLRTGELARLVRAPGLQRMGPAYVTARFLTSLLGEPPVALKRLTSKKARTGEGRSSAEPGASKGKQAAAAEAKPGVLSGAGGAEKARGGGGSGVGDPGSGVGDPGPIRIEPQRRSVVAEGGDERPVAAPKVASGRLPAQAAGPAAAAKAPPAHPRSGTPSRPDSPVKSASTTYEPSASPPAAGPPPLPTATSAPPPSAPPAGPPRQPADGRQPGAPSQQPPQQPQPWFPQPQLLWRAAAGPPSSTEKQAPLPPPRMQPPSQQQQPAMAARPGAGMAARPYEWAAAGGAAGVSAAPVADAGKRKAAAAGLEGPPQRPTEMGAAGGSPPAKRQRALQQVPQDLVRRVPEGQPYLGVFRTKSGFQAQLRTGEILGMFSTPEHAALAYDDAIRGLFGAAADCNFAPRHAAEPYHQPARPSPKPAAPPAAPPAKRSTSQGQNRDLVPARPAPAQAQPALAAAGEGPRVYVTGVQGGPGPKTLPQPQQRRGAAEGQQVGPVRKPKLGSLHHVVRVFLEGMPRALAAGRREAAGQRWNRYAKCAYLADQVLRVMRLVQLAGLLFAGRLSGGARALCRYLLALASCLAIGARHS